MNKNVQIPEKLFIDVYKLIQDLNDYDLKNSTLELKKRIEGQLNVKLDALNKRDAFTKYKTNQSGTDEREEARKKYLKISKINKDFTTEDEQHI